METSIGCIYLGTLPTVISQETGFTDLDLIQHKCGYATFRPDLHCGNLLGAHPAAQLKALSCSVRIYFSSAGHINCCLELLSHWHAAREIQNSKHCEILVELI